MVMPMVIIVNVIVAPVQRVNIVSVAVPWRHAEAREGAWRRVA